MALKKPEEKEPTAAEVEAKRVADAKAEQDAADQKVLDDAAAQKVLDDAAEKDAADQKILDDQAEKEVSDKEVARLARLKEESEKEATSDLERLAQEAEVALAAGKQPKERKLVEVLSLIDSDLRQPSTGTWITGKSTEYLLDDGWLENQINSRLMQYA